MKAKTVEQEAAKIILNELTPRLKKKKLEIKDSPIPPSVVSMLARAKFEGWIDHATLRLMLDVFFAE
jgi:Asp-tRNA(Asn)/Glu-tRNA(Gln) amidotransferase B subunit